MSKLPVINQVTDLAGKRVFVRGNLDVPIEDEVVVNQFRLLRFLPTLTYLTEAGAKVILAGHVGRDPENTAAPIYEVLKEHLDIVFSGDAGGPDTCNALDSLKDGQVLLLENLRRDPREKNNDPEFAHQLAALADLYVNAAFANAHREHTSMVGVPQHLPAYLSMDVAHEVEELTKMMQPQSPSLFLLGGAKFETKMPLVAKYLELYDHVFVGGALANDIFKAKGFEVGESLVSDVDLTDNPILRHPKLLIPSDVTVMGPDGVRVCAAEEVAPTERILDAGPETTSELGRYIEKAQMILWNGPFGDYEHGFGKETRDCATLIAGAPAYSVIGGGDTVAAIEELNNQAKFNFLSTAGGAMLTFLEHGSVPAIDVVINAPHERVS